MKLNVAVLLAASVAVEAFVVNPTVHKTRAVSQLFSSEEESGAVFKAPDVIDAAEPEQDDGTFDKVEKFGRGAAKVGFHTVS